MSDLYSEPPPDALIHKTVIPVRYSEIDQMGVVHHGAPVMWFEEGRTRLMADAGYPYSTAEADGVFLPVVELCVRYRKPAKYGGSIIFETWIARATRMKVVFRNRLRDDATNDFLIDASVTLGCLSTTDRKPRPFNDRLQRLVETGGREA